VKPLSFQLIIIDARRWFARTYGNTYHSVTVTVKHARKPDLILNSDQHYGYGDHYIQTAADMLTQAGYFADYNAFQAWRRDNHPKCYVTCHDVSRERDL
jgi:hypothetical protein